MKEVGAFGWQEAVEQIGDAVDQSIDRTCRLLPQQRFALGEGHPDRVHVRAVGWQIEDLGVSGGDRLTYAGDLMRGSIVEHQDITSLERGSEYVLNVGEKGVAVHRPVEHPGRGYARETQPGYESHRFPVPKGYAVAAALADRRPTV